MFTLQSAKPTALTPCFCDHIKLSFLKLCGFTDKGIKNQSPFVTEDNLIHEFLTHINYTALIRITQHKLHLQLECLEVLLTTVPHDCSALFSALERIRVLGVVPGGERGPLGVEGVVEDARGLFRRHRGPSVVVGVEVAAASVQLVGEVERGLESAARRLWKSVYV